MDILIRYLRRRSIIQYRTKLAKYLAKDYGKSEYYLPAQIEATLKRNKFKGPNTVYAFAMFCDQDTFTEYSSHYGLTQDYAVARKTIGDVIFHGRPEYKQADISVASSVGDSNFEASGEGGDGGGGGE